MSLIWGGGMRAVLLGALLCALGASAVALADVTPPAIDVAPCPSCRGDAADIDACDRALDRGEYDKAIELCGRALRSESLSSYDRAIGHLNRAAAYYWKGSYDRTIQDCEEA